MLLLSSCSSASAITGLIAGGAAGGATANPAVGYAVGLGVRTVASSAFKYAGRVRHHAEQDAIAAVAGPLSPGAVAAWSVAHTIPIGDEDGQVMVMADIENPLAPCRAIAFTVHEHRPETDPWFTTTICRQTHGAAQTATWAWSEAEPAVERWGYLQ